MNLNLLPQFGHRWSTSHSATSCAWRPAREHHPSLSNEVNTFSDQTPKLSEAFLHLVAVSMTSSRHLYRSNLFEFHGSVAATPRSRTLHARQLHNPKVTTRRVLWRTPLGAALVVRSKIHELLSVAPMAGQFLTISGTGYPNLNLTSEEKRIYGQLFKAADPDGFEVVSGDVAVKFFDKTRLPPDVLGQVRLKAHCAVQGN